jgi:threonine dehydratase
MSTAPTASSPAVTYADVAAAARRLDDVVHRTPVMTSRTVDARVGAEVAFKCEGYNAVSQLPPAAKEQGVVTYSSGNHAQAVALAGRELGVDATIIMPETAPQVKLDATRGYGAEVVEYDPTETVREELGQRLAEEHGLTLVPPYDHPDVVAGQGTVGDELFDQVGALDVLLVCCGGGGLLSGCALAAGGGLLSGCALAARHHAPDCTVIGVEPAAGDDATRSFHSGELQTVESPDTVADGARTPYLGDVTFPLVLEHADDMVTVSDAALVRAMHLLWERTKMVVEPTGALGAAALLDGVVPGNDRRIGVVVSGGNVDLSRAHALFERYDLE